MKDSPGATASSFIRRFRIVILGNGAQRRAGVDRERLARLDPQVCRDAATAALAAASATEVQGIAERLALRSRSSAGPPAA